MKHVVSYEITAVKVQVDKLKATVSQLSPECESLSLNLASATAELNSKVDKLNFDVANGITDMNVRINVLKDITDGFQQHGVACPHGGAPGGSTYHSASPQGPNCPHCIHVTQLMEWRPVVDRALTDYGMRIGAMENHVRGGAASAAAPGPQGPSSAQPFLRSGRWNGQTGDGGGQDGGGFGPGPNGPPGGGFPPGIPGGAGGAPGAPTPIRWNSKLFDDKVGLDMSYHWDGAKGGAAWRDKIRGYIIGCCPPLRPVLDWAESKDCEPVTPDHVVAACHQYGWLQGEDPSVIAGHLWRLLKMVVDGEAKKVFIALVTK